MTDNHEHLWFMRRADLVRGPFPQRQITRYILLGRIREDDQLSTDREIWTRVVDLPDLIPEVMKAVHTEEDQQRLLAARMREDERAAERRFGSERMLADNGERRRASDRRQEEDNRTLRHRALRRSLLHNESAEPVGPCGPVCIRAALVLLLLVALFIWYTPDRTASTVDCSAPPAPQVSWTNCRLPGLSAERANLRGAQARNMDLTGSHLVGANLMGSDLAYSTLNLADLRHADLSNAHLTGAGLLNADLRSARLAAVDFSYADLRGARLEGADLSEARFDHAIWVDGHICLPGSISQCLVREGVAVK